jgi:glycosyltransferase involved in cell wall biosynthesis
VDLVVTQQLLLQSSVEVARRRDVPVAVFVRAYSMFCPTQFRSRDPLRDCDLHCGECFPWHRRLGRRAVERNLEAYRNALARASLVIANSHYVKRVIQRLVGLEARVVYPFTDLDRYRSEGGDHDRVLFVKPQYVKGLPIALAIARRMPDTRFLVAGRPSSRARRALGRLANVELCGWVSDMREVYARTRVLLGPSIWPEPFGRVFVEAGAAGIPSVGSARGGIPEAIGDGGLLVEDVFDVERWVEALRALEDPATWADRSAKARAHAERFAVSETVRDFVESVRTTTGIAL